MAGANFYSSYKHYPGVSMPYLKGWWLLCVRCGLWVVGGWVVVGCGLFQTNKKEGLL